jgi:hypothetical protein
MKLRIVLLAAGCLILTMGCSAKKPANPSAPSASATPPASRTPGPLPDRGFKAQITLPDPPKQLRAGQQEVIILKVKNASDIIWYAVGGEKTDRSDNKFYIAVGNRWFDKEGKVTSDTEGHHGIPKNLQPGEETETTLQITAPKQPGEYTLSLDMVQEGVTWFADKGSPATKVKVTVVK